MLGRHFPPFLTAFLTALGVFLTMNAGTPAYANDATEIGTSNIVTTLIADIDSSIIVTLDGETLNDTAVHRDASGELYVDAMPIFQTLGNEVEFNTDTNALIVRRAQDGVVMELYTKTGIVKADGKTLGRLDRFGEISSERFIMTPNAIAVMSGAAGQYDKKNNRFDFKLDPRLRITTGFELIINGAPVIGVEPPPKSVGPVLLLPLLPLADELGHFVTVTDGGSAVKVVRNQDSATFVLNLDTGLITLFDNPIGISKDVTYIDPVNLLIPVSAFETLTGTNVEPDGEGRILIDFDDRLTDVIEPDGTVAELAEDTPFEFEYLAFEAGPQSVNRVELGAHARTFNGRLRAEISRLPSEVEELRPDWLSLDIAHISGTKASLGDNLARYRELESVGGTRFRGLSAHKETEKGRWALSVGQPAVGAKSITNEQTRLEFGGLAAGVRYADRDGWEAGLAVRHDNLSDDQMAILSAISGRLGRHTGKSFQWDGEASLGVFSGRQREGAVDIAMRGQLRRELTETIDLDLRAEYSGVEFERSILRQEAVEADIADTLMQDNEVEDTLPDIRSESLDRATVGATLAYRTNKAKGPFETIALSSRITHDRVGVRTSGEGDATATIISATAASQIKNSDLGLSGSISHFTTMTESDDVTTTGTQLTASAYKPLGNYTVRTRVDHLMRNSAPSRTNASIDVTRSSLNMDLPKKAFLSVTPSVSALYQNDQISLRGGAYASLDSGELFGPKTRVNAAFGIVQTANSQRTSRSDRFLTMSVARNLHVGKNMAIGLGYRADLRGKHEIGLLLKGRYDFNPRRRLNKTDKDTGLLQGFAFIDENRDGIRQPNEIGAGGVIIRLRSTRFALRTDPSGAFTVQNLRKGLYEVQLDNASLPLGYSLSRDANVRVSVKDGHVSTIELPIHRNAQLRGAIFVDQNQNAAYDRGELRVEGATVDLLQDGQVIETTGTVAFGQFAFDQLPFGKYEIKVRPSQTLNIAEHESITVNLSEETDGYRVFVPVSSHARTFLEVNSQSSPPDLETSPGIQPSTGLPPP